MLQLSYKQTGEDKMVEAAAFATLWSDRSLGAKIVFDIDRRDDCMRKSR